MPKGPDYFLLLRGHPRVLLVGGGKAALQKLKGLPSAWKITVIAPEALAAVKKRGRWVKRSARLSDVDSAELCFLATDNPGLNARLASRALKKGKLASVADQPGLGNFSSVAVARAGALSIAISSGGLSPALAKALRIWLEERLKRPALQRLAKSLGSKRAGFKKDPAAKAAALKGLSKPTFLKRMLR